MHGPIKRTEKTGTVLLGQWSWSAGIRSELVVQTAKTSIIGFAPPAGFFGSALVFTSAPPIGPAPGQSPPGAYALVNLEGIAEYLVGDHQSFTIAAGIPAEELSQAYTVPGNASVIGMAFKNWNPATEWNSVISAMKRFLSISR